MEKINLDMSFMEMIMVMGEGNPGAITVLANMMKDDPIMGPLRILHLDHYEIRGSKLWMLYKDCCGQDLEKMYRTLDFLRGGAYSQEEIDTNFQMPRALPFLSDTVQDKEFISDGEDSLGPWSDGWNEYVQANRATIIPRLEQFKQEFGDGGLKF